MTNLEEQEQCAVRSDLLQHSLLSSPENPGSLAGLQKFISDTMYLSETHSGADGIVSAKGLAQGGRAEESGCPASDGEGADDSLTFHNLLPHHSSCAQSFVPPVPVPGILLSQNTMLQLPLENLTALETSKGLTESGYAWHPEGDSHYFMMSGNVYEGVTSISSGNKDDQQREQSVCSVDWTRKTVVMNSCSLKNTQKPGHNFATPVHHFKVLPQGETPGLRGGLGRGPCSMQHPTYLSSPSIPLIQPTPSFLQSTCCVPSASIGRDMSYNLFHYCSQFHQTSFMLQQDSTGLATENQSETPLNRYSGISWDSRSKKSCNCTKSQCLKLYCDCFANGDKCNNCNCINCYNNAEHESERYRAIKTCLERNPEAFQPKIANGRLGEIKGRHSKGCNCKRSGCLKNYCECYEAKIMCSSACKCVGCRNYSQSPNKKVGIFADYDDSMDTSYYKEATYQHIRCPLACVTLDVVKATCGNLIGQAEKAEREGYSVPQAEIMILQEFGQCLTQIVQSIFKYRDLQV